FLVDAAQEVRDVGWQMKTEQVVGQQTFQDQRRARCNSENLRWRKRDVPELREGRRRRLLAHNEWRARQVIILEPHRGRTVTNCTGGRFRELAVGRLVARPV